MHVQYAYDPKHPLEHLVTPASLRILEKPFPLATNKPTIAGFTQWRSSGELELASALLLHHGQRHISNDLGHREQWREINQAAIISVILYEEYL